MSGPDVEGVLLGHRYAQQGLCVCGFDLGASRGWYAVEHRAHVAAAVRAEVRAWLESEGEAERMAEAYWKAREEFDCATTEQCMNAALAALAEQVGQVASVGEGEG